MVVIGLNGSKMTAYFQLIMLIDSVFVMLYQKYLEMKNEIIIKN